MDTTSVSVAWAGGPAPGFAFGYAVTSRSELRRGGLRSRPLAENEAWWTRSRRIRTAASLSVAIPIAETTARPVYQRIAAKAAHLRELGMTYPEIGEKLGVDRWTAGRAVRWFGVVGRE